MKAIVQYKYGGPETLELKLDLMVPTQETLGANQVLINVKATSLNAPDWRLLRGKPWVTRLFYGLLKPKHLIRGGDLSGVIEAVGKEVNTFKVGDQVMADLSDQGFGAWAEYVCASVDYVAPKPENLSYTEAAALPLTSVTALQALRDKAKVSSGERLLIAGASGGVGSYALQIAKSIGANVTALTSARHGAQALSLGADAVIDYEETSLKDFGQRVAKDSRLAFDVIVAINGYQSLEDYKSCLKATGRLIVVGGSNLGQVTMVSLLGGLLSQKGKKQVAGFLAKPSAADLAHVCSMVESGQLKPVIAREIRFEDIPKWLEELEKGHTGGKIVASL